MFVKKILKHKLYLERCVPLRSGTLQRSPLSVASVSTVLDFLAKGINKEKEIAGMNERVRNETIIICR